MIGGTCRAAPLLVACLFGSVAEAARIELASLMPELAQTRALSYGAAILTDEKLALTARLQALSDAYRGGPESRLTNAIRTYYGERGHRLVWMRGDRLRTQAFAVAARLRAADQDGLDAAAYRLPDLSGAPIARAERRAEIDVAISFAAVRFATHLAAGRVAPRSISGYITQEPEAPAVAAILTSLRHSSDPQAALDMYQPPHAGYHALRSKLAELRAAGPAPERVVIPDGASLRPGASDDRVPLLRERLAGYGAPDDPDAGGTIDELDLIGTDDPLPRADPRVYDATLLDAVRAFQAAANLTVDGIVGPRTLAALNGQPAVDPIAEVLTNMERWRWMPRDLGPFHVAVNIPEFRARVNDEGLVVHSTRVIVGTPQNQTPVFSDEMEHLVVNPYWNVPTSILRNEMLSAIRANPSGYFARHGYEVISRTGRGRRLHPSAVNWYNLNPRSIRVRQPPGERNALGRIKFMFPNKHSVYLHDTPAKNLFERDVRAFSHGCVRVQDPFDLAGALLAGEAKWTVEEIKAMVGGRETRLNLSRKIPVHLSYFTLNIEDDGSMRRFADLYGHDRKLREALGL